MHARSHCHRNLPTEHPFRKHRCIVVADGLYEWKQTDDRKQPYYTKLKSDEPMALADRWESKDTGESITSTTIITTHANTIKARA